MVSGRNPPGYPVSLGPPPRGNDDIVFGAGHRKHEITGLPLEEGLGALPPDVQAVNVHLPQIYETQGEAAHGVMKKKLEAYLAAKKEHLQATIEKELKDGHPLSH